MLISSVWSVFVFHEIKGLRNFILLGSALSLNVVCILCVAFSS